MASVRDSFIRLCLKPSVECDLPGRLRLRFGRFEMLPSAALPYLHYIEDILGMLAGVREVRVNARIGTILILYEAQTTSSTAILRWVDTVVEEPREAVGAALYELHGAGEGLVQGRG